MKAVRMKKHLFAVAIALAASALAAAPGDASSPSSSTRYATDAYPGFDREENIVASSKKTPRWFGWINGPAKDTAAEQLAYAEESFAEGSFRAARRAYDALVREWPSSPEAPKAQEKLADMYFSHYLEYDEAFDEYKYLLDFYSSQCDYDAVARRLYDTAEMMREEGKTLVFFRFANTVDVRRAYEAVVLRAPGAAFAPAAMKTIASLREDDGEWEKAVEVYENLRNLYPASGEARESYLREAADRMHLLREHAYNRPRTLDTIAYLKLALQSAPSADDSLTLEAYLKEATELIEDEAFRAAKFYDSKTRTRSSAIAAYERFLKEYPASGRTEEVRARIEELKGGER